MASGGLSPVGDEQVLGGEGALDVVERREALAGPGAAHDDRAREPVDVEGMQRLADGEHHVVRHVDGERDRAHPRLGEAALEPGRRRPGRVDATHDAGDVAVAAAVPVDRRRVVEADRVAVCRGGRGLERGRVAERPGRAALGVPVLTGEAAHREAVAPVGRHVGLDGLLGEAEQRDRVVAGREGRGLLLAEQPLQDDDPLVVVPESDLVLGADHPVGDVPVGLARRDGEVSGQDRSGQHDDDEVADLEVVGAADDLLVRALGEHLAVLADVDGAPPDRLAVLLRLEREVEDPTDDERPGEVAAVQVLLLETHADEARGHVGAPGPGREVGVLGEPAERHTHVRPPSRTAARSGRRPRPSRASPGPRGAASAPARSRGRRRSRSRRRGRSRTSAAPCG